VTPQELQALSNDQVRALLNSSLPQTHGGPVHDIRPYIPRTAQTDPSAFPAYQFREYPKMMLKPATEGDIKEWFRANAQTDDRGNTSYRATAPAKGQLIPMTDRSGHPIIVKDIDEEKAFLDAHPDAVKKIGVDVPQFDAAALDRLREDNERLKAAIAENARLKAEMAEQPVAVAAEAKPAEPVKHHAKTKLAIPE
jgi:hypothetical protein